MSENRATENLEPDLAAAAASATRKMMQAAGLQESGEAILKPEGTAATIAALLIWNLALASFMVEAGLKMDAIKPRLDRLAAALPFGHSARVLEQIDRTMEVFRNLAPDHLKE